MDFREDEFDVFEKGDFMETIRNVEINQLHDFKNHPFKVEVNKELCELMKSIEKEGVLVPLLVRTNPYGDGYEIISGHRRKEAAVWAGETKVPVVIRELDDDQAVVAMVDFNLHRENLKPSEKAFAYKMKLDAMKHQGKRLSDDSLSDNEAEVLAGNEANHMTLAQVGPKCDTDGDGRADNSGNRANEVVEEHSMMNSNELLARQVGESVAQLKRYIQLTNLIPKILAMVDEGKIAFTIGVELSYLSEEEQYELHAVMDLEQCTPSLSQANRMKRMSQRGELGMDAIYLVLEEEKPNQSEQIKIRADTLDDYFPDGFTPKQKVELIKKLVKEWHEVIENFLREGETDISEPYAILMKEAAGRICEPDFPEAA
jgi:ParB family chromosome partitioning protein